MLPMRADGASSARPAVDTARPSAQTEQVYAQRGDAPADVAARYGVSEQALRQANPDLGVNLVAGQALRLPAAPAPRAEAAAESASTAPLAAPTAAPAPTQRPAGLEAANAPLIGVAAEGARQLLEPPIDRHVAMEGYRAADGLKPGQAAPAGSFTDTAERAFARIDRPDSGLTPDRAVQAEQALLRVGVGLQTGRIEPHVNDGLRQQLGHLAHAPLGSDFNGSLAQLTSTGQAAARRDLTPGTRVVHDAAAGQDMRGAGLTPTDPQTNPLLDRDTSLKTRGADGVDTERNRSSKLAPSTLAAELQKSAGKEVPTGQLGRQYQWMNGASEGAPRANEFFVLDKSGHLAQLLQPKNLDQLAKTVGSEDARHLVIGDRAYSVQDLRQLSSATEARVKETGDYNTFKQQWEAQNPGSKMRPMQFYDARLGTPEALMRYSGVTVGAPVREAAVLARPALGDAVQGAKAGALAGGALSVLRMTADGDFSLQRTGEALRDTAAAGVAGAVTAKGERLVAPLVDRAIGPAAQRAGAATTARVAGQGLAAEGGLLARSVATRAVGSTAVGAVISTGISAYENRAGLARGDSKAIGNVAADTAVGAASVVAGMAAGAAVGSVVPVVGTAVGAVVGGVAVAWGAQASGARDAIASGASKAVDWVKGWF